MAQTGTAVAGLKAVAVSARAAPIFPAAAAHARASEAVSAPSPELAAGKNGQETSAARLSSLSLAKDSEPLWTGGSPRIMTPAAVTASATRARPSLLAAPSRSTNAAAEPAQARETIVIPAQTLKRRVQDAVHYAQITGSSLWWYTFPRLIERWDEMAGSVEKSTGRPRAVKAIMAFFIAHRVLGSTGSYAPMGFRVAANQVVVDDAWRIYNTYFPKDSEASAAFARLVERSQRFNPNRRSTQFRKIVFHALREAAAMPPAELPAFFDSLATDSKAGVLSGYQAAAQPAVMARFEELTNAVILEMNASLPAGRRVVGTILLGSFANGAAGPGSDLDVQTLSEDGGATYNLEFLKRLKARWKTDGMPSHPVSGFEYGLPLSQPLLAQVHKEPYLVVSPYPEVRDAVAAPPGDLKGTDSKRGLRGLAFVGFYSAVLFGVLAVYESWRRISRRIR